MPSLEASVRCHIKMPLDTEFEYAPAPHAAFDCCVLPGQYDTLVHANLESLACVGLEGDHKMDNVRPDHLYAVRSPFLARSVRSDRR